MKRNTDRKTRRARLIKCHARMLIDELMIAVMIDGGARWTEIVERRLGHLIAEIES